MNATLFGTIWIKCIRVTTLIVCRTTQVPFSSVESAEETDDRLDGEYYPHEYHHTGDNSHEM